MDADGTKQRKSKDEEINGERKRRVEVSTSRKKGDQRASGEVLDATGNKNRVNIQKTVK